jgi:hypothetical protein
MHLFDPDNRNKSHRHARLYASFEVLHTMVDFLAATLFIIGSVLFFSEQTKIPATWCFLIGSLCFALKPALRLIRELRLATLKETNALAARAPEK